MICYTAIKLEPQLLFFIVIISIGYDNIALTKVRSGNTWRITTAKNLDQPDDQTGFKQQFNHIIWTTLLEGKTGSECAQNNNLWTHNYSKYTQSTLNQELGW